MRNDVLEQFSSSCVLHNKEELFFRLDDFIELDNDGMRDDLEDIDFTTDSVNV